LSTGSAFVLCSAHLDIFLELIHKPDYRQPRRAGAMATKKKTARRRRAHATKHPPVTLSDKRIVEFAQKQISQFPPGTSLTGYPLTGYVPAAPPTTRFRFNTGTPPSDWLAREREKRERLACLARLREKQSAAGRRTSERKRKVRADHMTNAADLLRQQPKRTTGDLARLVSADCLKRGGAHAACTPGQILAHVRAAKRAKC
jgi:hypothetical protein